MKSSCVALPSRLTPEKTLCFAADLNELPQADDYIVDATELSFATPFGMLLAASALRRFRDRVRLLGSETRCVLPSGGGSDYIAHMGFWKSFGLQHGKAPGEASGGQRYIPIRELRLDELLVGRARYGWPVSQAADTHAIDVADVLVQNADQTLENTLRYAIRELFRNVADHSGATSMWYCAQYWPRDDRVEFGILDEGRGILNSLRENPDVAARSEAEAVKKATQRGVSRFRDAGSDPSHENSGDGLFVIREVSAHAGNLFVLSNSDGVYFDGAGMVEYATSFVGTAVRVELRPSQLNGLLEGAFAQVADGRKPSRLTPSRLASLRS